jgi:diguanylate cyclase
MRSRRPDYHLHNKDRRRSIPLSESLMALEDDVGTQMTHQDRRKSSTPKFKPHAEHHWLVACTLTTLYLVALALFQMLGVVQRASIIGLLIFMAAMTGVFLLAFQTKLNLKFREKRLKLPIVISCFACMLALCYFDPTTHIIFVPFSFIVLAYGMTRMTRNEGLWIVALVLVSFAAITVRHFFETRNFALLQIELMHFIALAASLPAFILYLVKERKPITAHHARVTDEGTSETRQRDALLGCYNHRYTIAALEQQRQLADKNGTPLSLAVIDLDNFKAINAELGQNGGDEVLKIFTRIALRNVRANDVFGRYGGEEFLLIFPNSTSLVALNTSERIRYQVEQHAWDDAMQNRVTVSIGVTQYIPGESVLELFSRADTAMYFAKQGGRNQVVVEEAPQDKKN